MATRKSGAKRRVGRAKKSVARKRATKKAAPKRVARKKAPARKKTAAPNKRSVARKKAPAKTGAKHAAPAKKSAAKSTPLKKPSTQRAPSARAATPAFDASALPRGDNARGLNENKPAPNTGFSASISKTLPVPLFAAFAAWADQSLRRGWLDAAQLDFTRLNAGRDIRARWPDGSVLSVRFDATAPDRCEIVVDAKKLVDAAAVERAKAFWQEQFDRLQAYLRI